jgi:uncharacterized protein
MPSAVVNWNDQDNNNAFHAKQVINCFNGSMSIELAHIDRSEGRIQRSDDHWFAEQQ